MRDNLVPALACGSLIPSPFFKEARSVTMNIFRKKIFSF